MEEILNLALKGADSAEVIGVESEWTSIEFKAGRLNSVETGYTIGAGLRVVKEGKIGFSSTTDLSRKAELVDYALASIRFGQEARFEFPDKADFRPVDVVDPALEDFRVEDGIAEGRKAVDLIWQKDRTIHVEIQIGVKNSGVRVLNSRGLDEGYEKTTFSYHITGMVVSDQGFLWVEEGVSSGRLRLETEELVGRLLQKVELARNIAQVENKSMPVIFAARAMPNLLAALQLGTNGKQVQKGASPLAGREGEKILDPRITIFDDGTLGLGWGSAPFDGEGVPCGRTSLFEKGVLRGYIFDLQTAGLMDTRSTGNARRSHDSLPAPGFTNLVVEPGDTTLEEMIKNTGEGLLVYSVLGGGQSNLLAGDFSLNVMLGYKIERGQLVGWVKDTMVAGNVYQALNELAAVGREVEEIGGFMVPPFHFQRLNVVSKT